MISLTSPSSLSFLPTRIGIISTLSPEIAPPVNSDGINISDPDLSFTNPSPRFEREILPIRCKGLEIEIVFFVILTNPSFSRSLKNSKID